MTQAQKCTNQHMVVFDLDHQSQRHQPHGGVVHYGAQAPDVVGLAVEAGDAAVQLHHQIRNLNTRVEGCAYENE